MSEQSVPHVPPDQPAALAPGSEVTLPPNSKQSARARAATTCLCLGIGCVVTFGLLLVVFELDSERPGSMGFPSEPVMLAFAGFLVLGWPLLVIATGVAGVIGLRSRRGVIRSIIGMILSWIPALIPLGMLLSR